MPANLRLSVVAVSTLAFVATVACTQPAVEPAMEERAAPANPLHGVWSVTTITPADGSPTIDPAHASLYIFVDGYYSAVYTNTADPRAASAMAFEPTPEEQVAQHDSLIVNTGTYEVSGSTITYRPIIAKIPEFVGGYATDEFSIDGDTVTLTTTAVGSADGTAMANVGESMTLRRIQ